MANRFIAPNFRQIVVEPIQIEQMRAMRDGAIAPLVQKFHRGDIVRLASKFPMSMAHFSGQGGLAAVMYSFADEYLGRDSEEQYSLLLQNGEAVSWYPVSLLTLIEKASHLNIPIDAATGASSGAKA